MNQKLRMLKTITLCIILIQAVYAQKLQIRANRQNCQDLQLMSFWNPPRNYTTGLISIPGSGNSWVMHLVQMATGIFIGSVYLGKDAHFPYYEVDNSSMIAIKDHLFHGNPYKKNVLVVRDPLETAISPSNALIDGKKNES